MKIREQIEWLDSVHEVFVLDCEPKQNIKAVKDTLERLNTLKEQVGGTFIIWQKHGPESEAFAVWLNGCWEVLQEIDDA